jgi:hypothetical protein
MHSRIQKMHPLSLSLSLSLSHTHTHTHTHTRGTLTYEQNIPANSPPIIKRGVLDRVQCQDSGAV